MPKLDFVRPMGVPGGPYAGDLPGEPLLLPDLSLSAEPAEEHLTHCVQLVRIAAYLTEEQQVFIVQALCERLAGALKAIGERRFTARGSAPIGIAG